MFHFHLTPIPSLSQSLVDLAYQWTTYSSAMSPTREALLRGQHNPLSQRRLLKARQDYEMISQSFVPTAAFSSVTLPCKSSEAPTPCLKIAVRFDGFVYAYQVIVDVSQIERGPFADVRVAALGERAEHVALR